jgi:hypothetical protein
VEPSDPTDGHNALSASFTITNTNFVPLRHVSVYLGLGQLEQNGQPFDRRLRYDFSSRVTQPWWMDHTLDMDERFTITPAELFHGNYTDGEIAIVVSYKPWFLPWTREKIFRFKAYPQSNGKVIWYSVPFD